MYDPTKPLNEEILKLIKSTWTDYMCMKELLYPAYELPGLGWHIDHTDGIGTKGLIHWKRETFDEAVQDVIAMNLNDLAMAGASGYKAQIHLVLPEENKEKILKIMECMTKRCIENGIAITGGETSIQDTSSFDISMTVTGHVLYKEMNKIQEGDIILGLPSNGPHSNGFTLLRKLYPNLECEWFSWPTTNYSNAMRTHSGPSAAMHITGGAYSKIKKILPKNLNAKLTVDGGNHAGLWGALSQKVSAKEFYTTWNGGYGMVVFANPANAVELRKQLGANHLGYVIPGNGNVIINPCFYYNPLIL